MPSADLAGVSPGFTSDPSAAAPRPWAERPRKARRRRDAGSESRNWCIPSLDLTVSDRSSPADQSGQALSGSWRAGRRQAPDPRANTPDLAAHASRLASIVRLAARRPAASRSDFSRSQVPAWERTHRDAPLRNVVIACAAADWDGSDCEGIWGGFIAKRPRRDVSSDGDAPTCGPLALSPLTASAAPVAGQLGPPCVPPQPKGPMRVGILSREGTGRPTRGDAVQAAQIDADMTSTGFNFQRDDSTHQPQGASPGPSPR